MTNYFAPAARPIDYFVYGNKLTKHFFAFLDNNYYKSHDGKKRYTGFAAHAPLRLVTSELGEGVVSDYFTFAFVRNPWTWLISYYNHIVTVPHNSMHEEVSKMTFAEFVDFAGNRWAGLQKKMVAGADGEIAADYVGNFETLRDDVEEVAQRVGVRLKPLRELNVTRAKKRDIRSYYEGETFDKAYVMLKPDIETFGYPHAPGEPPELKTPPPVNESGA